jgi:hypothetical protein
MSYTPETEEQLQKEGLLPDGIYDFQIIETEEGVSKKTGNKMFIFKHNVYAEDGSARIIKKWITFGNNFGERLFRHAADTCGILEKYTAGTLTHTDFLHKSGKCEVGQRQDDKLTWWNEIKEYIQKGTELVTAAEKKAKPAAKPAADLNDEIPF